MRKRPERTSVREALKETLQAVAGRQRGGAKALAQVAGVSPRAVESWLYEANAPGTTQLLALASEYDEVWDLVCLLTGRKPVALSARQRAVLAELLIKLTDEEAP